MANLEFANLFLPANNASSAAIAAGSAAVVAVDEPALARTSSFSQLLQADAMREPATGATLVGLAGLPEILNGAGMPAVNQLRALRPNLAVVTPTDPGASSLDLLAAAALLIEGLTPGAETGETADSKDSSADADPVDLEDPPDESALAMIQWPGLPLFMEARAALRNDSSTGHQPEQATSVTGIESARWSFMLRSADSGQLAGDGRTPASLTPATPEISATDAAELAAAIAEIERLPAQTESESPEPVSFNAPLSANPVAQLATDRTDQTASTMPPEPPELADPALPPLRNPVAQLATGRIAPIAPTEPPEPTEPVSPHLRNPVASSATAAKPERIEAGPVSSVASSATAAKPERIEAEPVSPVAQLATGRIAPIAPTEPPEPTEPVSPHLRNPVASSATAAKPERIEAGPVSSVASSATAAKPERIEAEPVSPVASSATAAKPERIEAEPVSPVAQLATGRIEPIALTEPPEPTEPVSPHLRNPVAALATAAKSERIEAGPVSPVASSATAAKPERIEAEPVSPVAQLATGRIAPIAPTEPPESTEPVSSHLRNPVAALATVAKPERIEAGPVNPVASLATTGQSGQLGETATVDTPDATTPELLPSTDGRPFSPQPLIAAPFAEASSETALEAIPRSAEPVAPAPTGSALPASQSPLLPARPDPATAPTSLPATPDVVDLNQKNWGRALGHQLNWMVNNQLQQAEIRVNPPDLGPIELRVSLQHNQTSVTFFCHESAVREALESALPRLREMLDGQGISLNQAQVSDQSLARQQAGGGQPSFSQRDDRPPANPMRQETVADDTEPRPNARRLPGTVDDYV